MAAPLPRPLNALIVLALAVWVAPATAADKNSKNVVEYDAVVSMGVSSATVNGWCLAFNGLVTSGDFFRGLKRTTTSRGPQFTKGSESVSKYPDRVVVKIEGFVSRCASAPATKSGTDAGADLMKHFFVQAKWKTGMEMRPAEVVSREISEPGVSVWQEYSMRRNPWVYTMAVNSKDVPLTDHLVVVISSKDRAALCRLAARP